MNDRRVLSQRPARTFYWPPETAVAADGTLEDYVRELASKPRPDFKPTVHYNQLGDFIDCCWKNVNFYAEQLTPQITLLKDFVTHEVVGIQVHGLLQTMNLQERTGWRCPACQGTGTQGKPETESQLTECGECEGEGVVTQ